MEALEPQLRELLEAHKDHFKLADNGKIECTLNGHTLPPRLDAVASFIKGAKFQKLSKRQAADTALQKYEPFIVQSKNFPLMLYCALTGQLIDKSVEAVKKHMKGKKFQRAKDRFAADELELKPEPSLESFGVRPNKAAQEQQQPGQQQQQEQANGAAGSDEEPGFWVPEGEEGGSSGSSGDGAEDSDDAEGQPGSSGEGDGEDMQAGPMGSEDDDPMEEDTDTAAAAAAAASKASKASQGGSKPGSKAKHRQPGSSKGGAAQNGAAAAAGAKKRNAQRPSAAKKARH